MQLEPEKASVTVSLAGVALVCINQAEKKRCEVGIISCPGHQPVLDIQKITLERGTGAPTSSSLVKHRLNLDADIWITVHKSETEGVSFHEKPGPFSRFQGEDDEKDFRWALDLEGAEFHERRLEMRRLAEKSDTALRPMIFISDGILYTEKRTDEMLARVSMNGDRNPIPLGKVAYKIGIGLFPGKGGRVVVSNGPGAGTETKPVELSSNPNVKYKVTIDNLCSIDRNQGGTDFQLFYKILDDPDARRFDLQRIVENGGRGDPGVVLKHHPNLSLDNLPQICLSGFLGETESLIEPEQESEKQGESL